MPRPPTKWATAIDLGQLLGGHGPGPQSLAAWDAVADLAVANGVAPRLHGAISGRAQVPPPLATRLRHEHIKNAARSWALHAALVEIVATLRSSAVPVLLIKGAAELMTADKAEMARWTMVDLDLVVPAADLHSAVEAMTAAGWERGPSVVRPFGSPPHDLVLLRPGTAVELHTEGGGADVARVLPAAELWSDATPSEDGWSTPPTRHRLLLNVLHAQIQDHHYRSAGIPWRPLVTWTVLAERASPEDWMWVRERAAQYGVLPAVAAYVHLARHLLGARSPDPLTTTRRSTAHVARCAAYLTLGLERADRNLRYAFEPDYLAWRYGEPSGRAWLARTSARHAALAIRGGRADLGATLHRPAEPEPEWVRPAGSER